MKNAIIIFIFMIILIIGFSGCINQDDENTIHVSLTGKGDYLSIQMAIDASLENQTISVSPGVYYEHVVINKTINLVGSSMQNTIIDGNKSSIVLTINSDNVTVKGFTIRNSGMKSSYHDMQAGIASRSNDVIITHCMFYNNTAGIHIKNTKSNRITHNEIVNNSYGIFVYHGDNSMISNNSIKSNNDYGCYVYSSSEDNVLRDNVFLFNNYGLRVKGNENYIIQNLFEDNVRGIYFCCSARDNIIYHNTLINNSNYNGKPNFRGNTWYKNSLIGGNYWSDYSGIDENQDGIGDTAYLIDSKGSGDTRETVEDEYPLMNPTIIIPSK